MARQNTSKVASPSRPSRGSHKGSDANNVKKGEKTGVQWVDVDENRAGQRLDNFLMARLSGVPRSVIYRIVRKGEVRINKKRAKPDTRLADGDQVRVPPVVQKTAPATAKPGMRVQRLVESAVVYEDDRMLVVNKPHGLAVHGGSGLQFGLIEVLRASRPDARFLELVHRLDRDTSGLIMIAKKRPALRHLQDEMRSRNVTKHYHALVAGHWPAGHTEIDLPLERYELKSGERMVRVADAGKPSLTRVKVLELFEGYSLVQTYPVTGRTHQIRVHCLSDGHPVAGDDKYMDDASLKAFRKQGGKRLMLHAKALSLSGPGGVRMEFEAPYDESFAAMIRNLRKQSK